MLPDFKLLTDLSIERFAVVLGIVAVIILARLLVTYLLTKQAIKAAPNKSADVLRAAAEFNRSFRRPKK